MKRILLIVMLIMVPAVANAACKCLKNVRGECMTLGTGPYPYRQFDEYISGPFCTDWCYPGMSDTYGYSDKLKKMIAACHIDWKWLRHELGRDKEEHWQF